MIRILLLTMLVSFVMTEVVELTAARFLGIREKAGLRIIFLVNLLTNPAVVFLSVLIPAHTPMGFPLWPVLLLLELAAWAAEALIYRSGREKLCGAAIIRRYPAAGPWLLSALLNLISYSAGMIFDHMAGAVRQL